MKIVVGIGDLECLRVTGGLLKALRFSDPKIDLVHVLERVGEGGVPTLEGSQSDLVARYMKMQENEAEALLNNGVDELKALDFDVQSKLLTGFSANRIVGFANEIGADLLSLGSSRKGPIESFLLGSVGRKALISATCSVLLAKQPVVLYRPLRIVLATDHSEYANRCIDRFLSFAPQGIERIIVTTVYPDHLLRAISSVVKNFKSDVSSWVRNELALSNDRIIQKLSELRTTCYSRIESGDVSETLTRVMNEEKADLLVLGAQGHGFAERVTMGSVSLEQSLRGPYSVLIVRC